MKLSSEQLKSLFKNYNYDPLTGYVSSKLGHVYRSVARGYPVHVTKTNGKKIRIPLHRMIVAAHTDGSIDELDVDHINGVRDDNRLSNLRTVTRSNNRRNSAKPRNNRSGVVGVCWHKHQRKWEVKLLHRTIGYSRDFFEACCIRKSGENKIGGFTNRHGSERVYVNSNDNM
jgi:hypothetical protein